MKREYERGPWDNEPDRVEFEHLGFPCLIVRNDGGSLCGYVAVPPTHPFHPKAKAEGFDSVDLEVHGGLTYGGECAGKICHVPKPGEPDDVYWFGFDTGHCGDRSPVPLDSSGTPIFDRGPIRVANNRAEHDPRDFEGTYKTIAYVRAECESLAEQLAAVDQ